MRLSRLFEEAGQMFAPAPCALAALYHFRIERRGTACRTPGTAAPGLRRAGRPGLRPQGCGGQDARDCGGTTFAAGKNCPMPSLRSGGAPLWRIGPAARRTGRPEPRRDNFPLSQKLSREVPPTPISGEKMAIISPQSGIYDPKNATREKERKKDNTRPDKSARERPRARARARRRRLSPGSAGHILRFQTIAGQTGTDFGKMGQNI